MHTQRRSTSRSGPRHDRALIPFIAAIEDAGQRVRTAFDREAAGGPLRLLRGSVMAGLWGRRSPAGFARSCARTLVLLPVAATLTRPDHGAATLVEIARLCPGLRPLLASFHAAGLDDLIHAAADLDVAELREACAIRYPGEAPAARMFELLVAASDPAERRARGVFYTPATAIAFLVGAIHDALRARLGLRDGLADTTTRGALRATRQRLNPGRDEETFIQILEPAVGTGSFMVEVVERVHRQLVTRWRDGGDDDAAVATRWQAYVPGLLRRLHGFEVMLAPLAITHLRIGRALEATGYVLGRQDRPRLVLGDALRRPRSSSASRRCEVGTWWQADAEVIQTRGAVSIIVGNPPWSNYGTQRVATGAWMTGLLADYKRGVREKKLNLDDPYIKFVRYGHERVRESGLGVVGLVTPSTYLDGVTHRRMRQTLIEDFEHVSVVDAHGSATRGGRGPDGERDESLFDVRSGVSLVLLAATGAGVNEVRHLDLWGRRADKLARLAELRLKSSEFVPIRPTPEAFDLTPRRPLRGSDYQLNGFGLDEIFVRRATGFETARDHFAVAHSSSEVEQRLESLLSSASDQALAARWRLDDKRDWTLRRARARLRALASPMAAIRPCVYRPFDTRYIHSSDIVVTWPRLRTLAHIAPGRPALVASRMVKGEPWRHVFVVEHPAEKILLSAKTSNNAFVFPLYRPEGDGDPGSSNIERSFGDRLATHVGRSWRDDGQQAAGRLVPEDVLHYIYALLHAESYRRRFAEFLNRDYPRVFLTSSTELFDELCRLGAMLTRTHLLRDAATNLLPRYEGPPEPTVVRSFPRYDREQRCIRLSADSRFDDVDADAWELRIGGYPVCFKWLKDRSARGERAGRALSVGEIEHYRRVVAACAQTSQLVSDIDALIARHGGWPTAFALGRAG